MIDEGHQMPQIDFGVVTVKILMESELTWWWKANPYCTDYFNGGVLSSIQRTLLNAAELVTLPARSQTWHMLAKFGACFFVELFHHYYFAVDTEFGACFFVELFHHYYFAVDTDNLMSSHPVSYARAARCNSVS